MSDWANISYNGESVGTLYLENGQVGYIPVVPTLEAVDGFAVVSQLIQASLLAPELAPEDVYAGILGSLDKRSEFSYEESSGELTKPEPNIEGLIQFQVQSNGSPYYIRYNEDDEVVSLVQETGQGILVREGGQWVEPSDSNYPEDEDYFLDDVTEGSIATYDRIVSENNVPTVTDLEVISGDD